MYTYIQTHTPAPICFDIKSKKIKFIAKDKTNTVGIMKYHQSPLKCEPSKQALSTEKDLGDNV